MLLVCLKRYRSSQLEEGALSSSSGNPKNAVKNSKGLHPN